MMRTVLLTLGTGLMLNALAQSVPHDHRTCGSHSLTQRHLERQGRSTDLLQQLPLGGMVERGGTYTIPVVVHVVYNNATENISTATINALIAEINADFSGTNSDINQVRPTFNSVVNNPNFQFCLAQVTPTGAATTGIVRVQTSDTWFDPDNETDNMKVAGTGSPAWDPSRYLNIWICDITSGATGGLVTVGYAYLPVPGVVGTSIDGLVIDFSYGTQLGARTATHEIGHYFGLLHTFDDGENCVNSDGFSDTPTSNSPTYSCANTSLMKCGVLTQYENFMDYSNCQVMFTSQQSSYMANLLNNTRSGLLTNPACSGPVVGVCIPTSTGGTSDGDYINRVALGTINNNNSGSTTAPAYTDFSSSYSTSLSRTTQYTLTVQGGTFNNDHVAAWIDYDQDDLFEAGEKLGETAITAANQTVTIIFTVPTGANLGSTTLRVRNVYHNTGEPVPTDPCFNYSYGETEDYGITITSGSGPSACIPTSANGPSDGDFINGVTLNTIVNLETGSLTGPTYTDYRNSHSTTLVRNGYYTVQVDGGTFLNDSYAVWIDLDQDQQFEEAEKLGEFATTEAGEARLIPFMIPVNTPLGTTTMRVRGVYVGTGEPNPLDPCYSYAYGETEDYRIVIAAAPSEYCTPYAIMGPADGDFINGVSLGSINNQNTGGTQGPSYNNYYTTHSTPLLRDNTYTLWVESGTYSPDHFTAWIDFDGDDVFSASENLGAFSTTAAGQTGEITFTVPEQAAVGYSRMRVRGVYLLTGELDPLDPCYPYVYGETEDYQVLIQFGTSVDERSASIGLWPNPTSTVVNVALPTDGLANVEVMDIQGRLVMTNTLNGPKAAMDVSSLAPGTYLVRVRQASSVITTRLEVIRN